MMHAMSDYRFLKGDGISAIGNAVCGRRPIDDGVSLQTMRKVLGTMEKKLDFQR